MSFRDKTSTRIDDTASAVSKVVSVNRFACLALLTKTKSFVGYQFISTEAIVKLDNVDLACIDTCQVVGLLSCILCHSSSNQIDS